MSVLPILTAQPFRILPKMWADGSGGASLQFPPGFAAVIFVIVLSGCDLITSGGGPQAAHAVGQCNRGGSWFPNRNCRHQRI